MKRLGDAVLAGLSAVNPKRARDARFRLVWAEAVGEAIRGRATARLDGSRVVIDVADERWAQEIGDLAELLKARLDAAVGGVREVLVRRVPARVETSPAVVAEAPRATVTLKGDSAVATIEDVELRELARRVAERYLSRRKRKEPRTGW